MDPPFESRAEVLNFDTFYFSRRLGAGEVFPVAMTLKAVASGEHFGQIDACTPGERCTTVTAFITAR